MKVQVLAMDRDRPARQSGRMATLLLLRHGQSDWNEKNLFTGWVDVPLSSTGEAEARRGGEMLAEAGLLPDVVHTSLLRRGISTANIALGVCERHWIPGRRGWGGQRGGFWGGGGGGEEKKGGGGGG